MNDRSSRPGLAWQETGDRYVGARAVLSQEQVSGRERVTLGESFCIPERGHCQKLTANCLQLICLAFFPKQFSRFPHSFHAILCNLGFSELRYSLMAQFHEIALLAQGEGRNAVAQRPLLLLRPLLSLWNRLLQRPLKLIRHFLLNSMASGSETSSVMSED